MKLFMPLCRAAMLIPSGPESDPDRKHLFILMTDPVTQEEVVLIVSVSTAKDGIYHDPACLLFKGDHSFIRHKSYVLPANDLLRGFNAGKFEAKEAMDTAIFARICAGLIDSRHTPPKIKTWYQNL